MRKLTVENTNAFEHRLAGDTLVFECPDCEWGEIVVTEMLEGPGSACPDCGAAFELYAARVGEAVEEATAVGEATGDAVEEGTDEAAEEGAPGGEPGAEARAATGEGEPDGRGSDGR